MPLTVLVAPSLTFLVVLLFAGGVYRIANQGGLLAKKRIAIFAPTSAVAVVGTPTLDTAALFKRQRFSSIAVLDQLLQRKDWGSRASNELAKAGLPLRAGEYLLIRGLLALAGLAVVDAVSQVLPIALVAGIVGYVLPAFYVRHRQTRRARRFDDQLVDALVLIANSLKSGYSFLQGMEAVGREMPDPIGPEFQEALREIRLGASAEDGLGKIAQRVHSPDFELVVTAMVIQRQVGGNLTEILSSISHTVRERHRILREVRVLTAEERLSGYVVAALPVFLLIMLTISSPGYIQGMWADPVGKLLLGVAFVLAFIGLLVMRKIVDIDV